MQKCFSLSRFFIIAFLSIFDSEIKEQKDQDFSSEPTVLLILMPEFKF